MPLSAGSHLWLRKSFVRHSCHFTENFEDRLALRVRAGALIENARCLPCSSVPRGSIWRNIKTGTVVIDEAVIIGLKTLRLKKC